jgi:UPF0271 protein
MTMRSSIDLNCDLGEGAGLDEALMPLITSANIACGAHAGDAESMRATVRLALRHGVVIGAHPGFADRQHFGRRELTLTSREIVTLVQRQVETLRVIAKQEGASVAYVKPHGALYNLAARDPMVAEAITEAVAGVDAGLWLYGLAGSVLLNAGRARGVRVAAEVFADRTYQADGSLTVRNRPDALLTNEADAITHVLRMVRDGRVRTTDGADIEIVADTVCLHGDNAKAPSFAVGLRSSLIHSGIRLEALAG